VVAGVLVADAGGEVELPTADGAGEFRAGNPDDFDGSVVVGLTPPVAPLEPTPGNGAPCSACKPDVVLSVGATFPHKTAAPAMLATTTSEAATESNRWERIVPQMLRDVGTLPSTRSKVACTGSALSSSSP